MNSSNERGRDVTRAGDIRPDPADEHSQSRYYMKEFPKLLLVRLISTNHPGIKRYA